MLIRPPPPRPGRRVRLAVEHSALSFITMTGKLATAASAQACQSGAGEFSHGLAVTLTGSPRLTEP